MPLPEKNSYLNREQIITIISTLSAFLAGIATIVFSVTGNFGGGGETESPLPKDNGAPEKMVR